MTIGQRIRAARTKANMTQKQLGDKCNINEANIRKYESGRQNPKVETLQKIADALEVPLGELINFPNDWAESVARQYPNDTVITDEHGRPAFLYDEVGTDFKSNINTFAAEQSELVKIDEAQLLLHAMTILTTTTRQSKSDDETRHKLLNVTNLLNSVSDMLRYQFLRVEKLQEIYQTHNHQFAVSFIESMEKELNIKLDIKDSDQLKAAFQSIVEKRTLQAVDEIMKLGNLGSNK